MTSSCCELIKCVIWWYVSIDARHLEFNEPASGLWFNDFRIPDSFSEIQALNKTHNFETGFGSGLIKQGLISYMT